MTELAYVLRLMFALFTVTLAIVGLAKHRPGDRVALLAVWWVLLAFGYCNLIWGVFDTIKYWSRITA